MTTELIDRLRKQAEAPSGGASRADIREAADEIEKLELRIADALEEIARSRYGDIEVPFRVRAHLEPENIGVTFRHDGMLRVPVRSES